MSRPAETVLPGLTNIAVDAIAGTNSWSKGAPGADQGIDMLLSEDPTEQGVLPQPVGKSDRVASTRPASAIFELLNLIWTLVGRRGQSFIGMSTECSE
jgi:hypothetical protein